MHSKSNNIEIMINDKVDEVIEDHFKLLTKKYLKSQGQVVI